MRKFLVVFLFLAALSTLGFIDAVRNLKVLKISIRQWRSRLLSSVADENPKYGGLNHAGILVKDTQQSKSFFIEVFGFLDDSHLRPNLPFPGAFLRFGSDQIHLMELPNPDPTEGRPQHGGRDRHVALTINNVDIIKTRLEARGVSYTFSQSGRRALFCRDLDGNAFEFIEDPSLK